MLKLERLMICLHLKISVIFRDYKVLLMSDRGVGQICYYGQLGEGTIWLKIMDVLKGPQNMDALKGPQNLDALKCP